MKADKKIITLIIAISIGTSSVFALPTNESFTNLSYKYTATSTNIQNGIVIKNVNLRTKPNSKNSTIIRTLKAGEKVIIVGKSGKYYKIKYKQNKYGYAYANNYIKIEENNTQEKNINIGVSTVNLNVRKSPSTSSSSNIIGNLAKGTKVEIVGQSGNFYKVKFKGKYGYASKKYLSVKPGLKLDKIKEIKLSEDVEVMELASKSSKKLNTLEKGVTVVVVEKLANNWYKIEFNNSYGYIKLESSIEENPVDKQEYSKIGISTADVNVRKSPSTSSSNNIIGKLSKGIKIEITGNNANFYKVKYKGEYGYISKKYISTKGNLKLDKIAELEITNDTVLKELASENSLSLLTLKQGTTVSVIERLFNGWYKIEINNIYGYLNPKYGNVTKSDEDINFIKEDGEFYYIKKNGGILKNSFKEVKSKGYYYFGKDGKAVKGIKKINGKTYFFDTRYSYAMSGLCSLNKNIYYFNEKTLIMETNVSKVIAGKVRIDIGSDGKAYKITKLDNSDLAKVLYSGLSKIGTRYSFNIEEGLDCSNYVSLILKETGLNIFSENERNSQQQAIYCEQNGLIVDKSSLQPGDILFYNQMNCENKIKNGYCSRELSNGMHVHHVAMYIGDGKIIESTRGVNLNYQNAGVRIYDVSYRTNTFYIYSIARVLKENK